MNEETSQEDSNIMKKQSLPPVEPRGSQRMSKGKPPQKLTYFTGKTAKEPASFREMNSLNSDEKKKSLETYFSETVKKSAGLKELNSLNPDE